MINFTDNKVDCPVCKSSTSFRSATANIKVCSICNTAMERLEGGGITRTLSLQVMKKETGGILQIGTRGKFNDLSFEIIGRLHCRFEEYNSNRWTILWADATTGLLVETLGFYAIYEKTTSDFPSSLKAVKNIKVGTESVEIIPGKQFNVFDKSSCNKVYLEGEVFSMDTDGAFSTIELGELNAGRLELVELGKGNFELYTISYVALYQLSLSDLRSNNNDAITLACAKCGKPIVIRLPQHSQHCVCNSCNGWNEIIQGRELKFTNKHFSSYAFDLPIGSKGTINGTDCEIVGAIEKNETGSDDIYWREYILYDTITGYSFLAEFNGHWTWLKEVKLNCAWPQYKSEIYFDGERFVLFNDYSFSVRTASGEFFTSLSTGNIIAREYISPPEMYAAEKNGGKDITWYKATHITNQAVFEGLGLIEKTMPYQQGIGPLQPMKFYMNLGLLARMCGIILLIFFSVQLFFEFNSKQEVVYQNTFFIPDSLQSKGITTASFQLKPGLSNLQFLIHSPVDNSWFEAAFTLVNDKTGTEYNFEKGVEYYEGYSDGERWSEGAKEAEVILSSIPAGNYHLNIFPSAQQGGLNPQFSISVINDVPMWRNFFFILLILAVYPAVTWWRTQSFEKRRWNNSAYNPYLKNDE